MALPIEIWLINPRRAMCEAFRERFADFPHVHVLEESFEDLEPHDCFVTAGNSFEIMNAGIDAAVVRFHGKSLMERIQRRILDDFLGEQPIGTSIIVPTGNREYPFVAHTPTMRVPGSIEGSDKVYAATWAALIAVHQHNRYHEEKIRTVAFPAMGAGFGGVPYSEAARQMSVAYSHYLEPPNYFDWAMVASRHRAIAYDGDTYAAK